MCACMRMYTWVRVQLCGAVAGDFPTGLLCCSAGKGACCQIPIPPPGPRQQDRTDAVKLSFDLHIHDVALKMHMCTYANRMTTFNYHRSTGRSRRTLSLQAPQPTLTAQKGYICSTEGDCFQALTSPGPASSSELHNEGRQWKRGQHALLQPTKGRPEKQERGTTIKRLPLPPPQGQVVPLFNKQRSPAVSSDSPC